VLESPLGCREKVGTVNIFTGKLNLCMDCDFYTTFDKGAQEHSKQNKHKVRRRQVLNLEISKEAIRKLKDEIRNV
jgi:hypothetical protein